MRLDCFYLPLGFDEEEKFVVIIWVLRDSARSPNVSV